MAPEITFDRQRRHAASSTMIVLGNGPSLKGFDFHRTADVDTLGMNAAYRYWDKIGWYPTYYCCLDDQLIRTHHREIKRLVDREQVRGAFLHGSFFDLHPECASDSRFQSLDQFHRGRFEARAAKQGLTYINSRFFHSSDSRKVTTGAYAIRYGAHLGYKRIALLGIDLTYVEVIPEARSVDDIKLTITKTPDKNPNYFFDDYQREGDFYNIPNPSTHDGNLHVESFTTLRDDFFRNEIDVEIINCNKKSVLFLDSILPYTPIEQILNETSLKSVVVPCTSAEAAQIVDNFELWSKPNYAPFLVRDTKKRPHLIFVFNNINSHLRGEIESAFHRHEMIRFFKSISIHSLGLVGENDAYNREYSTKTGNFGHKAGPNNQFFATMDLAAEYGGYAFLMETDVVPLRPNWLGSLCALIDGSEPFFVLGSAYRGKTPISTTFARHINGNAIYAAGDPAFIEFLSEFWKPTLWKAVSETDRRLAYDCLLEYVFHKANSEVRDDALWRKWQGLAHLFRHTDFIQNLGGVDDISPDAPIDVVEFMRHNPNTYLVHNRRIAEHIRLVVLAQSKHPAKVAETTLSSSLRFSHDFLNGAVKTADGDFILSSDESQYAALVFKGDIKPGDVLEAEAIVHASKPVRIRLVLCRDGTKSFESSQLEHELEIGEHPLRIRHRFVDQHSGARLQLSSMGEEAEVRILKKSIFKVS